MFPCDKCGICCTKLDKSPIYQNLNRGDGVCLHFDEVTLLCRIYETRPDICNVDLIYDQTFKDRMKRSEFYHLNLIACRTLQDN